MARVYYVTYMDPATGFLKREEYNRHADVEARINQLKDQGVKHWATGSFERE